MIHLPERNRFAFSVETLYEPFLFSSVSPWKLELPAALLSKLQTALCGRRRYGMWWEKTSGKSTTAGTGNTSHAQLMLLWRMLKRWWAKNCDTTLSHLTVSTLSQSCGTVWPNHGRWVKPCCCFQETVFMELLWKQWHKKAPMLVCCSWKKQLYIIISLLGQVTKPITIVAVCDILSTKTRSYMTLTAISYNI